MHNRNGYVACRVDEHTCLTAERHSPMSGKRIGPDYLRSSSTRLISFARNGRPVPGGVFVDAGGNLQPDLDQEDASAAPIDSLVDQSSEVSAAPAVSETKQSSRPLLVQNRNLNTMKIAPSFWSAQPADLIRQSMRTIVRSPHRRYAMQHPLAGIDLPGFVRKRGSAIRG